MTVSRVLNQTGNVSYEKHQAVMRAVKLLDYHPNSAARTLATKRSNTIGLLMTVMQNVVYATYIEGIITQLRKQGFDVLLYYADSFTTSQQGISTLLSKQIDGMILLPLEIPERSRDEKKSFCQRLQTIFHTIDKSLVLIGNKDIPLGVHILENYTVGAEMAVEHLILKGHRKIGFIRCLKNNYPWDERSEGFHKAMAKHGLTIHPEWEFRSPEQLDDASALIKRWAESLKSQNKSLPTAFYCANDMIALGTMHAFSKLGIRVPGDISVIGHDDSLYSACSFPRMTTIAIAKYETGKTAAKVLIKLLKQKAAVPIGDIYMPPALIPGETVRDLEQK